jgi:hypothetical protein
MQERSRLSHNTKFGCVCNIVHYGFIGQWRYGDAPRCRYEDVGQSRLGVPEYYAVSSDSFIMFMKLPNLLSMEAGEAQSVQ